MKKGLLFIISLLLLLLSGCILSKTPSTNDVAIPLGDQMTFIVNIFPSKATYTWTLDEVPLVNTGKSYVYTATAGNHILTVKAKHALGTDTQTWNISTSSPYLGPTPYLSFSDSPFKDESFSYFYLEDFEDGFLNTPGVTASSEAYVYGPNYMTDSVDGDDGSIDGSGTGGHSFFKENGAEGITFTFDEGILGSLPTDVGLVWTDGAGDTSFEAFDNDNVSLGVFGPFAIADGSIYGTTAEDRFFGISWPGGISSIHISNTVRGIEIDHLQYGTK